MHYAKKSSHLAHKITTGNADSRVKSAGWLSKTKCQKYLGSLGISVVAPIRGGILTG